MPEKRYYWLKLKTDFFNDKVIKKLRKIAGGDTFVIIYLKLMLVSINDSGIIYYDGIEKELSDELALIIDEDPDNVKVTLAYLDSCGLIELEDEKDLCLCKVPELIGSEAASTSRSRKSRNKNRLQNDDYETTALQCNVLATDVHQNESKCNIEKESDKSRIDKKQNEKKSDNEHLQQIVDLYHSICKSYSKVVSVSDKRKREIVKILKRYSVEQVRSAFMMAEDSNFLKGGSERGFKASFDWLMNENNLAKVLNGQYNNNARADRQNNSPISESSFAEPVYYKDLNTELSPEEKEIAGDPLTPEEQEYLIKKREEGELI